MPITVQNSPAKELTAYWRPQRGEGSLVIHISIPKGPVRALYPGRTTAFPSLLGTNSCKSGVTRSGLGKGGDVPLLAQWHRPISIASALSMGQGGSLQIRMIVGIVHESAPSLSNTSTDSDASQCPLLCSLIARFGMLGDPLSQPDGANQRPTLSKSISK